MGLLRKDDCVNYTEDKYNRAKSDMLGELNKAILEAANGRKAATGTSGRTYQLAISPTNFISSRFTISCVICAGL